MGTGTHRPTRNPLFDRIRAAAPGSGLLLLLISLQAAPPVPDTDLIPTGSWTYRVTVGGEPVGEFSSEIRREEDRIISSSDMTGSFIQRGSVTVDASTLRPVRSSTFLYQPGEGSTTARLTYHSEGDSLTVRGNVTWGGLARPPAPVNIDRTLPAQSLFDNQSLDLLIAALPLEENAAWRIELFEPTSWDRTITVTIDVRGETRVTTPAGRFDVWRVEVRGFSNRVEYFIDQRTRVLVVQHLQGDDLRLELVSGPQAGTGERSAG